MRKYEIMAKDHPLAIKRLAKELNANGWQALKAFYVYLPEGCFRSNRARVRKGKLELFSFDTEDWAEVSPFASFGGNNGGTIEASLVRYL